MTEFECIISDSQNQPLASAVLESRPQDAVWRIRVPEADIQRIISYGIIRVISLDDRVPNVNAEILSQPEPDLLTVSPSAQLDASIRLELRIPVRFESFLYSLSPRWSGRAATGPRRRSWPPTASRRWWPRGGPAGRPRATAGAWPRWPPEAGSPRRRR